MTTKLKVNRYNLRRPEPPTLAAVVAPRAMPEAAPQSQTVFALESSKLATKPQAALLVAPDDGFGPGAFPTSVASVGPQTHRLQANEEKVANVIDRIRREGLTGRQLRQARRLAVMHSLPATSDFDAVRLLRLQGIDPLRRTGLIDLIRPGSSAAPLRKEPGAEAPPGVNPPAVNPPAVNPHGLTPIPGDMVKLPQTIKPIQLPSVEKRADQSAAADILTIRRDIARRRRRAGLLLMVRLGFFVVLPTLVAAWYFFVVATPIYAVKSQFVIQQSQPAAGGMGGLLSGTQFATSQDSIAVQGYLQSRDAMLRLDADSGFSDHFKSPLIDPVQRLAADATVDAAYKAYTRNVQIAYDPTEGIIKMEVAAADPNLAAEWSRHLISYAEEQVDKLTQRMREDQMQGARESYEQSAAEVLTAQRHVIELQEKYKVLSSEVEVSLLTSQITALEAQLSQDRLSLAQMEANETPNRARMDPLIRRIGTLENEIGLLRAKLTESADGTVSLAKVQGELLVAQSDVQTRQMLLGTALQSMETTRTEANRQVRYLSVSVSPSPPDEPTYPRAFENTLVTMLIFTGIYLMIAMTAAILREQVTS